MKIRIFLVVIGVLVFSVFLHFIGTVSASNTSDVSIESSEIIATIVSYDDVLSSMHNGQWFGWSDPDNKVYENLIILDAKYQKPTEIYLLTAVTKLQSERNSFVLERNALEIIRTRIEAKILEGSYTDKDLIDYLRILGGF